MEFETLCLYFCGSVRMMDDVWTVPSLSMEYQKEALDTVKKIVECGQKILAEIEKTS
jgi:hypothetical protein